MPIVEWNDDFSTGVEQFDAHHKHLISLLNRVYDNFTGGAPAGEFGAVLDDLIDYATYHFAAEEYWMQELFYPKSLEHRELHDTFTRRVVEIQSDFHAGRRNLSIELLSFLKNWLIHHILESDAEYGRFFMQASMGGIKPQV